MKLKDEEKKKELELVKDHFQKKLDEALNSKKAGQIDQSVVDDYEKQKALWISERQFLQE